MKTLLPVIAIFGLVPATWAQDATLADAAKASRARVVKAARVVTNDDIPERPLEPAPAPVAGDSKPLAKSAPATDKKAAAPGVPCPADQLRELLDQESSLLSGIEVLKGTVAVESDASRLYNAQGRLQVETEKLEALQRQIKAARNAITDPPANCNKPPAKEAADASTKQPAAQPAPATTPAKPGPQ